MSLAPLTIAITGATGFIGSRLVPTLINDGHSVILLARNPAKAKTMYPQAAAVYLWAPGVKGEWSSALNGIDALVNLAGESIGEKRWNDAYKQRLRDSRIQSTSELVDAMAACSSPPPVFVSASAIGYFGDRREEDVDENSAPGDDFLAKLVADWEREAAKAESVGIRTVMLRFGIILDAKSGALAKMLPLYRCFLGGPLGNGIQWFTWVHIEDVVGSIRYALEHGNVCGPFNVVAPGIVRQKDFGKAVGKALGRPSWLPAPAFALKLVLGELGATVLTGQKAIPRRALESGYVFRYPELSAALEAVLNANK